MPRAYAIRDWNPAERSFRVVASTPTPVRCVEEGPDGKPVEYWEALEGWDLTRFVENPIIVESHDAYEIDKGIGLGSDFKQTPDGGLEMKVTLAPHQASKRVQELEEKIKAGILRGVSVGYDNGVRSDEERDGKTVRVYRNNVLCELSLCLIPKDERTLLTVRSDEVRTDAGDVARFDFISSVSSYNRTQVGGLRVPARITRVGVLAYKRPDGSVRRELRLPEEVFHADSLATLKGATVTDWAHHKGLLDVHSWKDATLGHADEVRQDGDFLVADLMVNDARAIADIENGRLHDISAGYRCKLELTPGTYRGEHYDCIQRRIRYNHVAVLPKGVGRAGPDVSLMRLDSQDAVCVEEQQETPHMAEPTVQSKTYIRIDGKDIEYGSSAHIKHLEDAHLSDLEKAEKEKTALVSRCDAAEGKAKDAETRAKKAEDDAKTAKDAEASDEAKAKRRTRERLLRRAIRALVTEDEDTTESESKMDALDEELSQLSDKDLMLRVIRTDAQYADDKELDDKPEAYIQAIFDGLAKRGVTRTDGVDSVPRAFERVKRIEQQGKKDPLAEARAKSNKTMQDAWKTPLS